MKNILLCFLFLATSSNVFSLELTLTQGTIKPTPIAVTDFYSEDDLQRLVKILTNS